MLEAGFYEEYHQERQDFGAAVSASPWHYPMAEMKAALQGLADTGGAGEEIVLEYRNRQTGGPVMPTISCYMQLLRPGEKTKAWRRVCRTNYHLVEGAGYSIVGNHRLDWEAKDVVGDGLDQSAEHVVAGQAEYEVASLRPATARNRGMLIGASNVRVRRAEAGAAAVRCADVDFLRACPMPFSSHHSITSWRA
jgi:hypothetical protein